MPEPSPTELDTRVRALEMKAWFVVALAVALGVGGAGLWSKLQDMGQKADSLGKQVGKLEQQTSDAEAKLKWATDELVKSAKADIDTHVTTKRAVLTAGFKTELEAATKSNWPQAIDCGGSGAALFMLHASPVNQNSPDLAWYVQVYPGEYRYVRFDATGSYRDRAGNNGSSIGCENKSIAQLRQEGKAYVFVRW